jgi:hypothetical protein
MKSPTPHRKKVEKVKKVKPYPPSVQNRILIDPDVLRESLIRMLSLPTKTKE